MILATGQHYIDKYGREAGASKMAKHGYGQLDLDLSDTENEYYAARDEEFIVKLLALKKALSTYGVGTLLARGPLPTETHSKEERALTFEKTVKAMVAVRHLGGRVLTVKPLLFAELDSEEILPAAREYYSALTEVAKGLGVTLCLENGADGNPLSRLSALIPLLKDIGSDNLRLSLSTGAANSLGEDFLAAMSDAGELLAVLRAEDSTEGNPTPLPLFSGSVNWAALAEALFDMGFSGILSVTAPVVRAGEDTTDEELTRLEMVASDYARLIAG